MTQDEPERVKEIRAHINSGYCSCNYAADVLSLLSVSEKRAETAERERDKALRERSVADLDVTQLLETEATLNSKLAAAEKRAETLTQERNETVARLKSERDSSQASLLRVVEECAAVAEHQQLAWEPLVSALYFKSQGDAYKHGCQDCAAAIRRTALSPHKET